MVRVMPVISTVLHCPAGRWALREIAETAEVVRENGHVYLVARLSSAALGRLATFKTGRAGMEEDGCDEPEEREAEHDGKEPGGGAFLWPWKLFPGRPTFFSTGAASWAGWGWRRRLASSRVMFSYRCPPIIAAKARFAWSISDRHSRSSVDLNMWAIPVCIDCPSYG